MTAIFMSEDSAVEDGPGVWLSRLSVLPAHVGGRSQSSALDRSSGAASTLITVAELDGEILRWVHVQLWGQCTHSGAGNVSDSTYSGEPLGH